MYLPMRNGRRRSSHRRRYHLFGRRYALPIIDVERDARGPEFAAALYESYAADMEAAAKTGSDTYATTADRPEDAGHPSRRNTPVDDRTQHDHAAPGPTPEAVAARYEARAALRDMWTYGVYGSRPMFANLRRAPTRRRAFLNAHGGRDPLNAYAETAARLARDLGE